MRSVASSDRRAQVNVALDPGVQDENDEELLSIGVLDIYGFEIFDRNACLSCP